MKKADKIIAIIIVLLVIISTVGLFAYKNHSNTSDKIATIKQNGKIIKTIDLNNVSGTQEFTIKYNGIHYNKIKVEKGKIAIIDADCPDKVCVKTGWLSETGQSSVCLPHKLIVSIEGKNSKYDDITR
ncbi:hypothetical protein J2Z42_000536 [Clostridium algifaecis]|uniref:NusG domain II-containing protein n=1 Tax=Clostridium algifaecis TaxID=1472040 RepID=A0ABS4KQW0_9CLOT|nr:NusG domain II-containing protein [Clostridium algifaecis]MBP2031871.1 hypothetical protein [Clostridium algifaecis]